MTPHRDNKGRFTRQPKQQEYYVPQQGRNKVEEAMSTPEGRAIMQSFVEAIDRIPETTEKLMRPRPGSVHPCLPGETLEDAMHRVTGEPKPADDLDEDTQAFWEAVHEARLFTWCVLAAAALVAVLLATNGFQGHPGRKEGHPLPAAFITSPALAVDPHLNLAFPAPTPQPLIIVGPFQVRGWKDGEPILFEAQ